MPVSATTTVVFMIGMPVAQTRSPVLFNRRFAASGTDCVMVPLDIAPTGLAAFVSAVRAMGNCIGFVATLPHKRALLDLVDGASTRAKDLGAVNVVRRNADGTLDGDMADGAGFWDGAAQYRVTPAGRSMIIAGAGAAATAIADEFARRGGRAVSIHARDPAEGRALACLLAGRGVAVELGLPSDVRTIDILVNATPVGMAATPGLPVPFSILQALPRHAFVADAITKPLKTDLLASAKARGLACMDGNAMTEGQFETLFDFIGLAGHQVFAHP